jgi:hypothetical protein
MLGEPISHHWLVDMLSLQTGQAYQFRLLRMPADKLINCWTKTRLEIFLTWGRYHNKGREGDYLKESREGWQRLVRHMMKLEKKGCQEVEDL